MPSRSSVWWMVAAWALVACPQHTPTETDEPLPAELGNCTEPSSLTWADVEPIFTENCTGCHASTRSGEDRFDAPVGVDFDSASGASGPAFLVWGEISLGRMPKAADPLTDDEALRIWEWLSCGGPE